MKRNKLFVSLSVGLLVALSLIQSVPVHAEETTDAASSEVTTLQPAVTDTIPILALGADLSAEQKQTVFSLMGIKEEDIVGYKVITITNDMEHQYLGSYMDASVIGTKSLSSVLITPKESGHGVVVTTKNINYCTTGMYRNALLTAGVSDAEILVAAPTSISGTAALIGAIKGYETMSGATVEEVSLDTAMDELITTGEIAQDISEITGGDSEEIEELIAFVKAKVAAGDLKTEEDIRLAIKEGEEKFGVTLEEEHVQQIIDIMMKINELGLDPKMLIEQAEDLYSKFGTDFFSDLNLDFSDFSLDTLDTEAIEKEVTKQVTDGFVAKIVNAIKQFFEGLFS